MNDNAELQIIHQKIKLIFGLLKYLTFYVKTWQWRKEYNLNPTFAIQRNRLSLWIMVTLYLVASIEKYERTNFLQVNAPFWIRSSSTEIIEPFYFLRILLASWQASDVAILQYTLVVQYLHTKTWEITLAARSSLSNYLVVKM